MKRFLSFLLAVCMTASFFMWATPQVTLAAGGIAYVTDAKSLSDALNSKETTELVLSGTIYLEQTLTIPSGRAITIRAQGSDRAYIRPSSDAWPTGAPLFTIKSGATVTFERVSLFGTYRSGEDAQKLAQGIAVEIGGANVTLNSVSIFYCNGGTKSGAGLSVGGAYPGSTCGFEDKGTVLLS